MAEKDTLPEYQARKIVKQLCEVLNSVHAQGMSHRNLKPSSIKVEPHKREGMSNPQITLVNFALSTLW